MRRWPAGLWDGGWRVPEAASYDGLIVMLTTRCLARQGEHAGRHAATIGERLVADTAALRDLPAVALEACEKRAARVSSTALVRYRSNDYSVPTRYGFQDVLVKGFVDEVVILCGGKEIARHPRCYALGAFVADPLHYLALIEMNPNALDQAAALQGWNLPEVFQHLRHLLEARMASVKLLIIDELGYVPLSPSGAELLFETFSQRYERGSTIVTSNLPFEDWTLVLGSERLTGALLDRLTHHVSILTMNGDSYRLKQSAGRRRAAARTEQNQAHATAPETGEITQS